MTFEIDFYSLHLTKLKDYVRKENNSEQEPDVKVIESQANSKRKPEVNSAIRGADEKIDATSVSRLIKQH